MKRKLSFDDLPINDPRKSLCDWSNPVRASVRVQRVRQELVVLVERLAVQLQAVHRQVAVEPCRAVTSNLGLQTRIAEQF
jgi:hypothetical protein